MRSSKGECIVSDKQVVSVLSLAIAALVAGALYLNLVGWNQHPSTVPEVRAANAAFDCALRSAADPAFDFAACYDRVQRDYGIGPYMPWYRQHPALTSLLAGVAAFVTLAGVARRLVR